MWQLRSGCRDKYDDGSPSHLPETLPNPTNTLCPLSPWAPPIYRPQKSKEIREFSIASIETYELLSYLAPFFSHLLTVFSQTTIVYYLFAQ